MTSTISWSTGFLLPYRRGTPLFNIIALLWLSRHEVKPTAIFVFMLNIKFPKYFTYTLLLLSATNSESCLTVQKHELCPHNSASYFHLSLLMTSYPNFKTCLFPLRHIAVDSALKISVCECKVVTSHRIDHTYTFHMCVLFDSFVLRN